MTKKEKIFSPFEVFVFDSKNTGRYEARYESLDAARLYAGKHAKARIDGRNGFMEGYEGGTLVAWGFPNYSQGVTSIS